MDPVRQNPICQVQYLYCRTGTAFNWPRHMEKCMCQWHGNIQCGSRSSSWGTAGTIHPTHQLLVRDAHSAAESELPSSACAAMESCLTSTSATLLAAQTSSSNSTDYCEQASQCRYCVVLPNFGAVARKPHRLKMTMMVKDVRWHLDPDQNLAFAA